MANIPFKHFMACLRPPFVAPSRFRLQKEIEAVFLHAQSAVVRILSHASVFLAVDDWEDAYLAQEKVLPGVSADSWL